MHQPTAIPNARVLPHPGKKEKGEEMASQGNRAADHLLGELADYVVQFSASDIPQETLTTARYCLIDGVGWTQPSFFFLSCPVFFCFSSCSSCPPNENKLSGFADPGLVVVYPRTYSPASWHIFSSCLLASFLFLCCSFIFFLPAPCLRGWFFCQPTCSLVFLVDCVCWSLCSC